MYVPSLVREGSFLDPVCSVTQRVELSMGRGRVGGVVSLKLASPASTVKISQLEKDYTHFQLRSNNSPMLLSSMASGGML